MGTTSWPHIAHQFETSPNITDFLICYTDNISWFMWPYPSASWPQSLLKLSMWGDIKGEPTIHRFGGKYLQSPCSTAQSPGILLGADGLYMVVMGGRLPLATGPGSRAIQGDSKENNPCLEWTERDFQFKGHPGCLNWNGWIWRGLCSKIKSRFSRKLQLPR